MKPTCRVPDMAGAADSMLTTRECRGLEFICQLPVRLVNDYVQTSCSGQWRGDEVAA